MTPLKTEPRQIELTDEDGDVLRVGEIRTTGPTPWIAGVLATSPSRVVMLTRPQAIELRDFLNTLLEDEGSQTS